MLVKLEKDVDMKNWTKFYLLKKSIESNDSLKMVNSKLLVDLGLVFYKQSNMDTFTNVYMY